MAELYLWVKVVHLLAVISWMAGMLYLPRLFVYHSQVKIGSESDLLFQIMEKRLLRYIMNPAMIVAFITGIILAKITWSFPNMWFHIKSLLVILLAISHGMMAKYRKDFAKGNNKKGQKFYRIFNEVPTLLMIFIVILVVIKPL